MANLFAQNTAAWDAANQWNTVANGSGSYVTPGSSDVCMANGKTVTVNISVTVSQVRTDTTGSATGSGGFVLSDGVTLTANCYGYGGATCVTYNGNSPNSATVGGNVYASTAGSGVGYGAIVGGTGTLNVTGNATGGSNANSAHGAVLNSAGNLIITGAALGNSNSLAGVYNNSSGTLTVSGGATAANGNNNNGMGAWNGSTGTLNVTGSVVGGLAGTLNYGIRNDSGVCNHTGTATATVANSAISGGGVSQVTNLTGPLISTSTIEGSAAASGVNPCVAARWFVKDASIGTFYWLMRGENVSGAARPTRTMYVAEGMTTGGQGIPAQANVRYGVQYGANNALTGTAYVPAASSVAIGVNVDNTVGTATLDAATFWSYAVSNLTAANSIGKRLKNVATNASIGAVITELKA